MTRLLATIGSILLACQLTLAGSGDLFLCLCVSDDLDDTPCRPTTEAAGADCLHDSEEERAVEYHDCQDILIEGAELEWITADPPPILKAPGLVALLKTTCDLPLPTEISPLSGYPRNPPPAVASTAARHYSKTIQLLL